MNRRIRVHQALRLVLALCWVWGVAGLGGPAQAEAQHVVKPWPASQTLPALPLQDLAGQAVKLSDFKGHTLVLNFWASWCEPCRSEMPGLAQLQELSTPDVQVLAVNFKESVPRIEQFARSSGLRLRWLRDPEGAAAQALGVRVFPTTLVISPQGQVLRRIVGEVDWTSREAEQLLKP